MPPSQQTERDSKTPLLSTHYPNSNHQQTHLRTNGTPIDNPPRQMLCCPTDWQMGRPADISGRGRFMFPGSPKREGSQSVGAGQPTKKLFCGGKSKRELPSLGRPETKGKQTRGRKRKELIWLDVLVHIWVCISVCVCVCVLGKVRIQKLQKRKF